MIAIINYGMGNLRSVQKAFEHIGQEADIIDDPSDLAKADKIVLPGVGAFPKGMQNLKDRGFIEPLTEKALNDKIPLLGICLGMQLLGTLSMEHEKTPGLGFMDMEIHHLTEAIKERVPHVGWNELSHTKDSLFEGMSEAPSFYFVHSLYAVAQDPSIEIARCHYGIDFCVAVKKDNIYATQFHPEKSQKYGTQLLKNFCNL